MPNQRQIFGVGGALLGLLAVAAGAFGTHSLRNQLSPEALITFETATRYQMYHALALLFCASDAPNPWQTRGGWAFISGIVVFCGSLYALSLGSPRIFGAIAPIGGLALMGGWVCLALSFGRKL